MRIMNRSLALVGISLLVGLTGNAPAVAQPSLLDPSVTQVAAGGNHSCALTTTGGVKCWGQNGFGQSGDGTTSSPRVTPVNVSGLSSGIVSISAGSNHTCALTSAGAVKCWGWNVSGQLGDGTTANRSTPVDVAGLTSGVAGIAAGYAQTCALTTAGAVKCWGYNGSGQLGDGTTSDRATPVPVGGLSGVISLYVGGAHACVVTSAGGVKCWGDNSVAQVGDGTTVNRNTPVNVSGLSSGVASLATGDGHTCALTTGGGVTCWGDNSTGGLGDGTTTQRSTPVNVTGLTSGVTGIAAGERDTCAVTALGGVKCWGYNAYGQLGDGTTTNRSTPTDVAFLNTALGVTAVSTNWHHVCVLRKGGMMCWGRNTDGQLGDGTQNPRYTTGDVAGLSSGVARISANLDHTCALTAAGGVKCWGSNFSGQLGDGTTTSRTTPTDVIGLTSGVTSIASGYRHTCAVTNAGVAKCWGYNWAGQVGDGTTTDQLTPVDVIGLAGGVTAITAGLDHTCALTATQGVKCWGAGSRGQLGNGGTSGQLAPVDVTGLTSGVAAISAGGGPVSGGGYTCALTTGGGIMCWGNNNSGQLGDGTSGTIRTTPVSVSGLSSGAASVSAGPYHTCAVTTGGGAKCWGNNVHGQLGDGTTITRFAPVNVSGLTSGVARVAVPGTTTSGGSPFWHAGAHTCAVMVGGGAKCWGLNRQGQLGDGTTTDRLTPVDVFSVTSGALDISLGEVHTCVLTFAGGVKCWGAGMVGDDAPIEETGIVDVSGLTSGVASISAGYYESCVVTTGGGAKCWGYNEFGGLGDGTITDRSTAVDVTGLTSGVARISAGKFGNTCAVTTAGGAKCWGLNQVGGLGDGTTTTRLAPVDVAGLTSGVARIDASSDFGCALTTGGGVKCWGRNDNGQLGNGTTTTQLTAVDVIGLASGVANLSAGRSHTCILTTGGGVKCWGANANGQLGDGTTTQRLTPVDGFGLTTGVVSISSGNTHTCALTTAGGVKCWGYNGAGQLGDGTTTQRLTATDVTGLTSGVAAVSTGYGHTCAVTTAGVVKCWGSNVSRQLGDGTTTDRYAPVDVSSLPAGTTSVAAASNHTCALTAAGGVKCWGKYGSLGNGVSLQRTTPVAIRAEQSLTFTPPAALTTGVAASLGGTASSALPVLFDSWTPGTCSVTGNSVTATAGALCGLRVSQDGDGNTAPASQVLRVVAVMQPVTAPIVTTPSKASVLTTSATLGATVTSDGGSAITGRGVVYATTATNGNPQIGGPGVTASTVSGAAGLFTSAVTGLLPGTSYSFRGYATNAAGTAYTGISSFMTLVAPPGSPTINFFNVSNVLVTPLGASTLSWSVSASATLTVNGSAVSGPSGSLIVNPAATTTYTLIATNGSGSVSRTVTVSVSDGTASVGTPTVTTPSSNQTVVVTGVGFSWTGVGSATGYDIRVFDGSSGLLVFSGSLVGAGATSTLISLPSGSYRFAVRACSGGFGPSQCGGYGTVSFTVSPAAPSGAPSVTFPAQDATLTSSTQTLSWTAVTPNPALSGLTYEVLLRDLALGTTTLQITVPSPSLSTIFTMPSSSEYELKVRACQASCGPFSTAVTFAVVLPSKPTVAPTISNCTVSGGNNLTCNWGAVANADTYQVQVVQAPPAGPGGGALTVAAVQVSATTVSLPVPPGGATVFIAACNGDGCGPNATSGIVAGGVNPSEPNIGTPMAGTIVNGPIVLFTWNRVPGDTGSTLYRLFVQDLSRQATALDVFTANNFYSAYFKAEGARYDALVVANPGLGSAVTGPSQGFNVAGLSSTAPTLVSPAHNSALGSGNIQLGWSPVPGATLYEYFVAVLGQGSASARGVTPGLLAQVPLTGTGAGTVYSGIVRACPVGATCMPGSDAGWGPWSNAPGGPGVTNFTVVP